jgi:hypothetical protein
MAVGGLISRFKDVGILAGRASLGSWIMIGGSSTPDLRGGRRGGASASDRTDCSRGESTTTLLSTSIGDGRRGGSAGLVISDIVEQVLVLCIDDVEVMKARKRKVIDQRTNGERSILGGRCGESPSLSDVANVQGVDEPGTR